MRGNGFAPPESHFAPASSEEPIHEDRSHTPTHDAVEREPAHEPLAEPEAQPVPAVVEPVPEQPSPPAAAQELTPEPSIHEPAVEEHIPEPVVTSAPAYAVPVRAPTPLRQPEPMPIYITKENPVNEELYAKFNMAQAEIEQLKAQIASLSTAQELRRRTRKLSDVDSNGGSDVQTIIEEAPIHQDGVPLQVVVVIALGVFVTTYLFF